MLRGEVKGMRHSVQSAQNSTGRFVKVVHQTVGQQRAEFRQSLKELDGTLGTQLLPIKQQLHELDTQLKQQGCKIEGLNASLQLVFLVAASIATVLGLVAAFWAAAATSKAQMPANVVKAVQTSIPLLLSVGVMGVACVAVCLVVWGVTFIRAQIKQQ